MALYAIPRNHLAPKFPSFAISMVLATLWERACYTETGGARHAFCPSHTAMPGQVLILTRPCASKNSNHTFSFQYLVSNRWHHWLGTLARPWCQAPAHMMSHWSSVTWRTRHCPIDSPVFISHLYYGARSCRWLSGVRPRQGPPWLSSAQNGWAETKPQPP